MDDKLLPEGATILINHLPEAKPLFCTRGQLKSLFGIKAQTAANWACQGVGPEYFRCGKLAVYEVETVTRFLKQNPVQTTGDLKRAVPYE